jgi:hypothetical protein
MPVTRSESDFANDYRENTSYQVAGSLNLFFGGELVLFFGAVSFSTKLWRSSLIFVVQIKSLNNHKYSPAVYCSATFKCRLNVSNHASVDLKDGGRLSRHSR